MSEIKTPRDGALDDATVRTIARTAHMSLLRELMRETALRWVKKNEFPVDFVDQTVDENVVNAMADKFEADFTRDVTVNDLVETVTQTVFVPVLRSACHAAFGHVRVAPAEANRYTREWFDTVDIPTLRAVMQTHVWSRPNRARPESTDRQDAGPKPTGRGPRIVLIGLPSPAASGATYALCMRTLNGLPSDETRFVRFPRELTTAETEFLRQHLTYAKKELMFGRGGWQNWDETDCFRFAIHKFSENTHVVGQLVENPVTAVVDF